MDKSNVFKAVAAAIFVVIIGIATIYVWSGLLGEDRTILQTAEYYATGQIKLPDAEEKLAKKLKMTERAQIANRVSELAAKLRNEDKTEEADKVARLATDLGTAEVGAADLGVEITTLGVPPTTTPLTAKTMAEVCAALDNAWAAEKWDEVIAILEANRDNQLACPPGSWESPYLSIAEKLFAAHYNNCEYARRQNDKTKAVAQCTRALALKPNDPQAAALLQQVSGGAVGASVSQISAPAVSETACPELQNAWNSENWTYAIQLLNEVRAGTRTCGNINVNDRLFAAYYNWGNTYLRNQQWAQAEQQCRTALNYRAQDPLALDCVQRATARGAGMYTVYPTSVPRAASGSAYTCADFEQAWNSADWARVVDIGTQMKNNVLQCDNITDWRDKLADARVQYGRALSNAGKWEDALTQCQFALSEKPSSGEAKVCIDTIMLALTPAQ